MHGRRPGRWTALALFGAVALAGCGKSATTDGVPDCARLRACGRTTAAPATETPPQHRSTAQACSPTPADAMGEWTYDGTGTPCTSDAQCTFDAGLPGFCLHGTCTADECLTDDDCGAGAVCLCSAPLGSSAVWNRNWCVRGNCQVDSDCGANGFCVPSSGVCGIDGFYCHTPADTCVDPAIDCGAPCLMGCSYFPDKGAFACVAPICGGC
jgi:hypothetical protein